MELDRFDLFAAAELGDVGLLERFFDQPHARAAALVVEDTLTDNMIQDVDNHRVHESRIRVDAWVYLHDHATNIFNTVTYYHQYEVMRWLYWSPFIDVVPKTLQFFLLEAASLAIEEKDPEMLEILLSSPLFADSARYTHATRSAILNMLLRASIRRAHEATLSVLTAHGADWQTMLACGSTPISEAAEQDRRGTIVRLAAENGAIIVGDQEAIVRAAEYDNMEALLFLLDQGADPRAQDASLDTPLHHAAYEGLYRIVGAILKTTCVDIDSQNSEGETALNVAVKENPEPEHFSHHPRVVDVLLRFGADTEIPCSSASGGHIPLRWAVAMRSLSVARKLLIAGAKPHSSLAEEEILRLLEKQ